MRDPVMAPRFRGLLLGVVATMILALVGTDARVGAAREPHSHATSAPQSELMERYRELAAALDAMASHDPAAVEAVMTNGRPTLLAFLDRGCVECLRMIPVVGDLRKDFEPTVDVVVLDTDNKGEGFRKLYRRYSIWAGPAFVVLDRNGHTVQRLIGPQSAASLRARLQSLSGVPDHHDRRPSLKPAAMAPTPTRTSGTPTR